MTIGWDMFTIAAWSTGDLDPARWANYVQTSIQLVVLNPMPVHPGDRLDISLCATESGWTSWVPSMLRFAESFAMVDDDQIYMPTDGDGGIVFGQICLYASATKHRSPGHHVLTVATRASFDTRTWGVPDRGRSKPDRLDEAVDVQLTVPFDVADR